jgi:hypothetical protein
MSIYLFADIGIPFAVYRDRIRANPPIAAIKGVRAYDPDLTNESGRRYRSVRGWYLRIQLMARCSIFACKSNELARRLLGNPPPLFFFLPIPNRFLLSFAAMLYCPGLQVHETPSHPRLEMQGKFPAA